MKLRSLWKLCLIVWETVTDVSEEITASFFRIVVVVVVVVGLPFHRHVFVHFTKPDVVISKRPVSGHPIHCQTLTPRLMYEFVFFLICDKQLSLSLYVVFLLPDCKLQSTLSGLN